MGINSTLVDLLSRQQQIQHNINEAMQGILRSHQDRMYDRVIRDLLLYAGSSSLDLENKIQNVEKSANITNYGIF